MTFTESIKHCAKNLTNFEGRASRSEYWWWYLAFTIASFAIAMVFGIIAAIAAIAANDPDFALIGYGSVPFILLLSLATLSVTVRRLHDTGRSAWWLLLWVFSGCTCGITNTILLVLMILEGEPVENDYGPVPPEHPGDALETADSNAYAGDEADRWA